MIKVPKEVTKIMKTLGDAGFENYVTGECVIDSMMGEKTYSWDVITKAGFEELTELFPEAKILSTKYSVLKVISLIFPLTESKTRASLQGMTRISSQTMLKRIWQEEISR